MFHLETLRALPSEFQIGQLYSLLLPHLANFDYLTINGEETSPLMGYDSDYKSRSVIWSKYHKHFLSRFSNNGLSSLPPLTSSEARHYYIKDTVSSSKIEL